LGRRIKQLYNRLTHNKIKCKHVYLILMVLGFVWYQKLKQKTAEEIQSRLNTSIKETKENNEASLPVPATFVL
jgi:hypothetical protein